jgi:type-F conjugative transfer system protein TrbI
MRLKLILSIGTFLIVGIIFYCLFPKTQVVVFDTKTVQAQLIRQLAEHKASEEQVRQAILKYKNSLHDVLTQYAKRHDVVILEQATVLSGGNDITSQLLHELSLAMKSKS